MDETLNSSLGWRRYAIINQDRWKGATPTWNNAKQSLRDYRHMVVNHEVGHWLDNRHAYCGGKGKKAPVMQQQSVNLGCEPHQWPLDSKVRSQADRIPGIPWSASVDDAAKE